MYIYDPAFTNMSVQIEIVNQQPQNTLTSPVHALKIKYCKEKASRLQVRSAIFHFFFCGTNS